MKILDNHIAYLKDNPEGYWFKRKLYGFGWTPAKKAGWITTILYILIVVVLAFSYEGELPFTIESTGDFLILFGIVTALFLVVVWKTGQPLKWQWGKESDEQTQ